MSDFSENEWVSGRVGAGTTLPMATDSHFLILPLSYSNIFIRRGEAVGFMDYFVVNLETDS
jgi:hypothetical protein